MKPFSENIFYSRKELGLTQLELAGKLGVSRSFIAQLESGIRKPSSVLLDAIEYRLGISRRFLLTGNGQIFLSKQSEILRNANIKSSNMPVRNLNIYKQFVCAGNGILADESSSVVERVLPWPADWTVKRDVFGLRVDGDSMEPTIPDGSIVLVDRNDRKIETGQIGVYNCDGNLLIREHQESEKALVLMPLNHKFLPIIRHFNSNISQPKITLIGKVITIIQHI